MRPERDLEIVRETQSERARQGFLRASTSENNPNGPPSLNTLDPHSGGNPMHVRVSDHVP